MKRLALGVTAIAVISAACGDQHLLQPRRSGPAALIADGAHDGNPDFFFLPPLVANPVDSPDFDADGFNADLIPTTEVCVLTGDPRAGSAACAATVFGPADMTLDQSNQHYHANWDTKSPAPLDPAQFYRILVRGARGGSVLGFLDVDPVDAGIENLGTDDVVSLQDGRTLPIVVRIESGAFGATNPDRVEQVVPNRIATGTLDVTTNTGFAGARFSDDWLPRSALDAGIDQVVVIIERIAERDCLRSGLIELEGCYRFRTDPDLRQFTPFNTFNVPVIAGVCLERPQMLGTDAPFQLHRREEVDGAPTGPTLALESRAAPFLTCDGFEPTPSGSVSEALRAGDPVELAKAGWHTLGRALARLVTPRALHAVDLGAGGSTDGFSRFSWARPATMLKLPTTDDQTAVTGTRVLLDPTVCLTTSHPGPLPAPLVSEPVMFAVTDGGGTVNGASSTQVSTDGAGCAHVEWVLGSSTTPGGNTLSAAAKATGSPAQFTATGVALPSLVTDLLK